MFINKNISVISSDVKRYNVIPATLSFSYLNKEHTIVDCVLDTGCSSSLISANSLNFEQTLKDAQRLLFLKRDVLLNIGSGVEGRNVDKSKIIQCLRHINKIKRYCIEHSLSDSDTERLICKYCSKDEYNFISRSLYTRYEIPVNNVEVNNVNTKSFGLQISFSVPDTINLIGMGVIQNLYMQTFSARNTFYTVLTNLDQKYIDKALRISKQLMEENPPVKQSITER